MNTQIISIWTLGLSIMFGLYYVGNPFGIYDDIIVIGGLAVYTVNKLKSVLK